MARRLRANLSVQQRQELWTRWQAGESVGGIARALARPPGTIYYVLSPAGGIAPALRHRAERALALEEREEITRGIARNASVRAIARAPRDRLPRRPDDADLA